MPANEHSTRTRTVRILRALVERPYAYTIKQLAERYGVDSDTIRGDFKAFENADFVLERDNQHRYAFVESKPLKKLKDLLHFTEEDQLLLEEAIDHVSHGSARGEQLKKKLASLYDFRRLGLSYLRKPYLSRIDLLMQAKEEKRVVVLRDYRSSNSNVVSDRTVEPFHVSPPDDIVHAFDIESKQLRHYRISRFVRVQLTDTLWQYEKRHIVMPTDPFRIVDSEQVNVHLRMRVGAYNELVERFPVTKAYIEHSQEEDVYDFQCMVNHKFLGISNFILGHHHQVIEVLQPEELIRLLNNEARGMKF